MFSSGIVTAVALVLLSQPSAAPSSVPGVDPSGQLTGRFPPERFPAEGEARINIVSWDANALPKVFQRSDQPPLTDADLVKLVKAGFESAQLAKMIEERRCACDASADGLIRLKQQGVPSDVISAISLHTLAPNQALNLDVRIDFTGDSNEARENFLYLFFEDGDFTRVLTVSIADLLSRQHPHDEIIDRSDILISRKVRRIELPGEIPLKTYGSHRMMVVASARPTLTHPSQLTDQERSRSQVHTFDYPRSSIQNICRVTVGYKRDVVLSYRWHYMGSRIDCDWN
jgi:hypothetical protein